MASPQQKEYYFGVYYVYLLYSTSKHDFYTGYTSNLKRRLSEHNSGENISTAYRRPLKLIYYEAYMLKKDAENREKYLKTGMGKRVIKKQLKNLIEVLKLRMDEKDVI